MPAVRIDQTCFLFLIHSTVPPFIKIFLKRAKISYLQSVVRHFIRYPSNLSDPADSTSFLRKLRKHEVWFEDPGNDPGKAQERAVRAMKPDMVADDVCKRRGTGYLVAMQHPYCLCLADRNCRERSE